MAATKRNAMWIEETRKKVQSSQLVNRLQDHALGNVEMSSTQVRAAEILLKKTLPDQTESRNFNFTRKLTDLSDGELIGIIAGDGSEGVAEAPPDTPRLN